MIRVKSLSKIPLLVIIFILFILIVFWSKFSGSGSTPVITDNRGEKLSGRFQSIFSMAKWIIIHHYNW